MVQASIKLYDDKFSLSYRPDEALISLARSGSIGWNSETKERYFPYQESIVRDICYTWGIDWRDHDWPIKIEDRPKKAFTEWFEKNVPPKVLELVRERVWGSSFDPFRHQIIIMGCLLSNHGRYFGVFADMGTGKTACCANVMRFLYTTWPGDPGPTYIACPKSAIQVWVDELKLHGSIDAIPLVGSSKKKIEALQYGLDNGDKFFITNYESMLNADMLEVFASVPPNIFICDEAHRIKNTRSKTWKGVQYVSSQSTETRRWALTGTPCPNGPEDLFGIFAWLNPHVIGCKNITHFRNRHIIRSSKGLWPVGYKGLEDLETQIAPYSITISKEECDLDLPGKTVLERRCDMTPAQKKIYNDLKKKAIARIENLEKNKKDHVVVVDNILTEAGKLAQICGGHVLDDDGNSVVIKNPAKMQLLDEMLLDLGSNQVIIWCSYRWEAEELDKKYNKEESCLHYGGKKDKDRQEVLGRFKAGGSQYLVATVQSLKESVTMTNCSYAIYYSRTWNYTDWSQSQDRIYRIGQTMPVTIYTLITNGTVEEKLNEALINKGSFSSLMARGKAAEILK